MTAPRGELITPTGAEPLPWSEVDARLRGAEVFWLTTVAPGGGPHTRPVLAVWVADGLCFTTSPGSAKGRQLARDPRCSVAVRQGDLDVVLTGRAERVRGGAELAAVAEAFAGTFGWHVDVRDGAFWAEGAPTAGPPPFHVLRLRPSEVHAFGTGDEVMARATRWRL
ncbi:pyridoxamine 5'-phosphate oxidase family protein [Georgenia sp. 10Sc9-8]|uniref:Pyridoxamine 5'-phosphate oxidase family protein n=1 Tax=Georgenia halotolerans TaxID=3028317 RepID=A0ABT5U1G9_9MICO|nr:pyridoxamine 5'-phosphate oxidase family protein [Georgenia halotolerans]